MSTWQDFAVTDLARSGLAITDIDAEEAPGAFGPLDGYHIPYYTITGERHPLMYRTRLRTGDKKYDQPSAKDLAGDTAPPYFHKNGNYAKLGLTKIITEGEKKSLAGFKFLSGVQTIGIGGCWNWQAPLTPSEMESRIENPHIPIMARLHPAIIEFCKGGKGPVYYVPDADYRTNEQVMRALGSMRLAFRKAGIELRIILLPAGGKGLDDFLMAQPQGTHDAAFWALEQTDGKGMLTRESDMQALIGLKLDRRFEPVLVERGMVDALARWEYLAENYYFDTRAVRHMLKGDDGIFRPMSDIHIEALKRHMQHALGFVRIPRDTMESIMYGLAMKFPRNPLADYLRSLHWDGVGRFQTLVERLGVPAHLHDYAGAVLKNLMVAASARALRPGTKFDHCVILEGHQGFGKSTFWEILATLDDVCYYAVASITANSHIIGTRDFLTAGSKSIFYDLDELGVLSKSDVNAVKTMLSTTMDTYRPAYGRSDVEVQRAFLCVGSTNLDSYLIDRTGNRRFWPIKVGNDGAMKNFDRTWLVAHREQLWAEAMHALVAGHEFWALTPEQEKQAQEEQSSRLGEDSLFESVDEVLNTAFATDPIKRPDVKAYNGVEYYAITMKRVYDMLDTPHNLRNVGTGTRIGRLVKDGAGGGKWVKVRLNQGGIKLDNYLLPKEWADAQPRSDSGKTKC